jgi:1,4-alpha-glucan branching enzyme
LPYLTYPAGVAFMARDEITGQQVWSRHSGYPGDSYYLEFHKKHFPGGLRYWRITSSSSDLADKLPYETEIAAARVEEHARHFVWLLAEVLKDQEQGIITSLYDTELFGHWWFEGPEWLYQVIKKLSAPESNIKLATASSCLEAVPPGILVSLPEGSWGEGGFHWIWLNDKTAWIWSRIYELEKKFWPLWENGASGRSLDLRLLKLLCQEKFLLESSDWPFLISTMTAGDYAETRASLHFERSMKLLNWLSRTGNLTPEDYFWLEEIESEDSLFREVLLPNGNII